MHTGDKRSEFISRLHAQALVDAVDTAIDIGCPLNTFVTIHSQRAGIGLFGVHGFMSSFLKLTAEWLHRHQRVAASYVYVLENQNGVNAHIVFHVAEELRSDFVRQQRHWLELAGGQCKEGALQVRRVRFSQPGANADEYRKHGIYGLRDYMLKGIDPDAADEFKIVHEPQGIIFGKRVGISHALGFALRHGPVAGREAGGPKGELAALAKGVSAIPGQLPPKRPQVAPPATISTPRFRKEGVAR